MDPGSDRATVVTAWIDWKRFSVARFETGHLFADGTYASRVELTTEGERLVARSGDMELAVDVERWPWHSYDFDLASLAFVWPHRTRPEEPFRFGVTDFGTTADGASGLVDKGWVTVEYAGRATREGTPAASTRSTGRGWRTVGAASGSAPTTARWSTTRSTCRTRTGTSRASCGCSRPSG